jgi:hypothetical protein
MMSSIEYDAVSYSRRLFYEYLYRWLMPTIYFLVVLVEGSLFEVYLF